MDNTADILLDNIMRVMSGEYFGQTKAAAIVGGKKKLERLIESGKIEAVKPRNSQNGKWFCNAAQVLMHCRNMRIIRKLLIIRVLIFNGNLEHIFSGMMQTADTYGVDLPGKRWL